MTAQSTLSSAATIPAQYTHLHGFDLLPLAPRSAPQNRPEKPTLCGISIHIPKGADGNYFDHLYREVDHYAQLFDSEHTIKQIWLLGEGLSDIEPAELTQLSYRLASQFRVSTADNTPYGIEISHRQITKEFLALLRGLQFSQLRIRFEAPLNPSASQWMEQISNNIDLLANFDFSEICCGVNLKDFPSQSDLKKLLLGIQLYQPQQIELLGLTDQHTQGKEHCQCSPEQVTIYSHLLDFFNQRGYRTLGNHLFVSSDSSFHEMILNNDLSFRTWGFCPKEIENWIGAGLGASGQIGENHYQNTSSLEQYLKKLGDNQMPYLRFGTLQEERAGVQKVIQSLFCQGRIEGTDIEQLPADTRLAIELLISHANEQLWLDSAGYTWELTTSGLAHLRSLFNQLSLCSSQLPQCSSN